MKLRDILLALFVVIVWAGNVIAIKFAVNEIAPLTALALRFGLTGLVLAPFVRGLNRALAGKLLQIALLMGFAHQGLLFCAMASLPAGVTSILLQTQVIFAALIGIFIFSEKTGWRTWTGIVLGMAGVAVMGGAGAAHDGGTLAGFALMIGSTLTLAFAYMRMKQLPPVAPLTFLFGINALAFPPVLAASLLVDGPALWALVPDADWTVLSAVFGWQIVFVGLSHIIWQRLLARNPISLVTPFTLLLPVFGVAMAMVLLDESLTAPMAAGGAVTMAGVAIIVLRRAGKKKRPIVMP